MKNRSFRLPLKLVIIIGFLSITTLKSFAQIMPSGNVETDSYLQNLSYGKDPYQKLDIALAKNRTATTPLVILVHGGGWVRGDKRDLGTFLGMFTAKGFNVANINYRLAGKGDDELRWKDMIEDVHRAIGFIQANAEEWKIRKDKYILWGASSGAHLAFLYGYQFDSSSLVSSVIGFGTPTRLNDPVWNEERYRQMAMQAMPALTGQSWSADTSNPELMKASPYYSNRFKPSLLIHGDRDNTVPYNQSVQLYELLQRKGVQSKLILLKNGGHWGQGAAIENVQQAIATCIDWITKYGT